jgi:glutaredoxin-related protein
MTYPKKVIVYGAMWCPDTLRAMQFFSNHEIEIDFKNIDNSPENTKFVEDFNNGMRIIPTIIFPDESVVVEPSNSELERIINRLNF